MTKLLTVSEVSALTRLSKPSIYRYTSKKQIPHIKIGGKVVFEEDKVNEWLLSYSIEAEAIK